MKKGLKKILPGTGAVLLVLAGGVMAGAAGKEQEYIFPEVDKELLTEEDVKDLPAELLAYGRYEILAKHGELFESEELRNISEIRNGILASSPTRKRWKDS